ncbi:hypothetical protein HPHPP23_0248 [Helicobacter pylori Hp P-23]|nr:hypothetical protein HPHPP23_0248 [Helicobacter pylori Hp P-23]
MIVWLFFSFAIKSKKWSKVQLFLMVIRQSVRFNPLKKAFRWIEPPKAFMTESD